MRAIEDGFLSRGYISMFLNMIDALFQNKCYFSFLVDIPLTCLNISINLDYNLNLRYLLI